MTWEKGIVKLQFQGDINARLLSHLKYFDGRYWEAEPGLIFDGASVPRAFWSLIGSPFTGYYRRGAVIHDAYYKEHRGRKRKQVDLVFKKIIKEDGVSWWKANMIYWAVRLGGRNAWRAI